MNAQPQTCQPPLFPLLAVVIGLLLFLNQSTAGAVVSGDKSAVSFSPTSIDFGQIPSHEHPTQLLTVTFDRRIFPTDHLPILRSNSSNGPALSLFSRFDGPNTITIVYRVAIIDHGENGPIQYNLSFVRDQSVSHEDAATQSAEDTGVSVSGEIIQGLDTDSKQIDFGQIKSGKSAVKEFEVGIFHGGMFELKSGARPVWPDIQNMFVTSSSPYVTAPEKRGFGLDGSTWETWRIVLNPKTPVGFLEANLIFRTGNGYSVTVPVFAEVTAPSHSEPKHSRKH